MQAKTLSFLGSLMLLCSSLAHADWRLDADESSFYYVTSKAGAVSEINSFDTLSGTIGDSGNATLVIDLNSVNTAIEIRDERMRELVFHVSEFPEATVTLPVDAGALEAMAAGSSKTGDYTATVNLRGVDVEYEVALQVLKRDANTLQVQLAKPLLVGAVSFGLVEGVEALREVAGLPSINPNVVVDFTLVYRKP